LGIFYRHSQHASIQFNTVRDNCIGIFPLQLLRRLAAVRSATTPSATRALQGHPDEIPFD